LQDRVAGRVGPNAKAGAKRLLTDSEEKALSNFIIGCASVGYAKSKKDILVIVKTILAAKDVDNAPEYVSNGWWDSFRRRHPEITLRHAEPLAYARAIANNEEIIHKYFDLLQETLRDNGLTERPAQVFNCDETGMSFAPKPGKVAVGVGQKHPYKVTSGDKSQLTVLACASASGNCIPPMVIFDRKTLKLEMTHGEVPGTFYGLSQNGWIDSELFSEWFKNHFLAHAPAVRPLLLLLDGHSSHYQPEFIRLAAAEDVVVFCLPPHSTHLLQPLDNGVFGSLKSNWSQACHEYMSQNPGRVVNRYNFSTIFSRAWIRSMSMQNIISSFKAVGVYPLDRSKALDQLHPSTAEPQATSLSFVPFLTPSKRVKKSQQDALPTVTLDPLQKEDETLGRTCKHAHPVTPVPVESFVFTEEEERLYKRRLEEGYDIPDTKYREWLKVKGICAGRSISPRVLEVLHDIGNVPTPPNKPASSTQLARVLTSQDCRKRIEEKEDIRQKKEEEKMKKRAEREQKAEERRIAKEHKEREKLKKRLVEKEKQEADKQRQKEEGKQKGCSARTKSSLKGKQKSKGKHLSMQTVTEHCQVLSLTQLDV
jgi:hypothetical protein